MILAEDVNVDQITLGHLRVLERFLELEKAKTVVDLEVVKQLELAREKVEAELATRIESEVDEEGLIENSWAWIKGKVQQIKEEVKEEVGEIKESIQEIKDKRAERKATKEAKKQEKAVAAKKAAAEQ